MEAIYGTNVLLKGHIFQTGAAATIFVQEYCFNQSRQCKVKRCSGGSKTYVRQQDGCLWDIRVTIAILGDISMFLIYAVHMILA